MEEIKRWTTKTMAYIEKYFESMLGIDLIPVLEGEDNHQVY